MSLGVHFALEDSDVRLVRGLGDPDELVELLQDDIEERYLGDDGGWAFESDKAWDAIHRCLTDGELRYESGPFPLAYAVLGGEALDAGDDYTACFTDAAQVRELSAALGNVTREWLYERYQTLQDTSYSGPIGNEVTEYTWEYFVGLRAFLEKAADAGRSVLFSTDA